jgi:hypothetical protein
MALEVPATAWVASDAMAARMCLACRTWLGLEPRCDACGIEHVVDLDDTLTPRADWRIAMVS